MSEAEMDAEFVLPAEEYVGPAVLTAGKDSRVSTGSTTDGEGLAVLVDLRGHFEPLDGRFHWYGRIAADAAVAELGAGSTVTLTTPNGSARGRLSDVDPWGRFRVTGTGRPPF
jgi:hypothetical protein